MVALIAGTLTTLAFIPQVVRAFRTRSVEDLSLGMLLTFSTGVALWMTYGMLVKEPPMVVTNGVTLLLALVLIGLKARWR